ncbi:MAG: Rrf2 family transcriptional regulator [Bacteroidetes bacterium]|nr:Rrf2 family transcriptional regulator [Bacteroidota bacterium]MBS1740214.1 Rrf2 family transcriptional regulator [Bacteroidota bacterium]
MFSKTCEYAIRAMIYVAQQSKLDRRVSVKEVAEGIASPEYFTAKILQNLSRNNLLSSAKGPGGGFFLDKQGLKAPLAEIVRIIDGDDIFTGCGLGLAQCSEIQPCPIHHEFKHIRKGIISMLEKTKVGAFTEENSVHTLFLKR